jgi:hypothetical protein
MPAPPIPPITDPELLEAVSALTRSAQSFRKAFFLLSGRLLAAGDGDDEDLRHVVEEIGEPLIIAPLVIDAWRKQLGHDIEDAEDGVTP